ncbi:ATP-binding protein [Nonomuraea purpurea]|uniref:ATP-binding protein n=1 Tax=Nonomuraea purpurea TaxID=1849276 RepID=A0ABV8G7D0_9ACTN
MPAARHFIRYLLADSPCQDDAEHIVAELAANAVQHTSSGSLGGTFIVEITRTTATITVTVYDCGWGGVPGHRRTRPGLGHGHRARRPGRVRGRRRDRPQGMGLGLHSPLSAGRPVLPWPSDDRLTRFLA